ncbi:eIF3 subunit 6 N terminal domain-containing protein [Pelagophyceae sp. CCMP2097]|nr:eIF3 subunit 6 N terminal domain-containing protein [Pelagophyceae sp. CCMP2097]|mmetsp:Transcript_9131/g.30193  ORF Transcript_9131/g.30193 Transcript_9131/m.30193 type:complete len:451 (-) Transcript_9131:60-1412(-)|eukprot:CAMPEP_0184084472 /NCGR_PEP_ID=MMETSP0974-20121125/4223_1 /TAXON_ID=483370 /ORGANISM="non described non described, Strain CCMP2097" /LENGTH=450 /DNA_ID=CAMNT_0026387147 /DNA_START=59 /DNA_END=1411 /DNA_ORIENTATION=-
MADKAGKKVIDASPYDLTHKIAPFLDVHLVFPLLEFLEENTTYDSTAVQRARLELLGPTNMVDYAIEIHTALNGGDPENGPADMVARRDVVFEEMESLEAKTAALRALLDDADAVEKLTRDGEFTAAHLQAHRGVTAAQVEDYYAFAKFLYECGDYEAARGMLGRYIALTGSVTSPKGFQALWGKFASEVLLKNWDDALVELNKLKQAIDDRSSPPLEQLQQRSWLLHWSLFVFFNHPNGHDGIIDLFLSEKYLQAIQTNCPWLLRYLTSAVIINKRRRSTLKDLVRILSQEDSLRADPVTQFLECLYVNFDFDGAQSTLRECERALRADYFLCNCADAFMEDARLFVFETYCRIHTKIDISMLAEKLVMDQERAERWIVDLIRGALLDAKIDSQSSCVVMGAAFPTVYTQVIEKTRDLASRSTALVNNIEAKLKEQERKKEVPDEGRDQ